MQIYELFSQYFIFDCAVQAVVKTMTPGYSSITKTEVEIERDELGRPIGKPWKKHHNKGKKEKIRRTQKVAGVGPGI